MSRQTARDVPGDPPPPFLLAVPVTLSTPLPSGIPLPVGKSTSEGS